MTKKSSEKVLTRLRLPDFKKGFFSQNERKPREIRKQDSAQIPSMKKKSTSQSAFFNLRVLIGLFIVLAGVFLALLGFGTFSGLTASSAQAQQTRNHQVHRPTRPCRI